MFNYKVYVVNIHGVTPLRSPQTIGQQFHSSYTCTKASKLQHYLDVRFPADFNKVYIVCMWTHLRKYVKLLKALGYTKAQIRHHVYQ